MRLLPVFAVVASLAACGDPLAGVGRLADLDVKPADPAAAALPEAAEVARDGFLGTEAADGPVPESVDVAVAAAAEAPAAQTQGAGGFFRGLIKRAANADPAAAIAADVANAQSEPEVIALTPAVAGRSADAPVELAALPAKPEAVAEEKPRKRGLFGGIAKKDAPRTGPDARDVPFGTVLAFGEIARVCDARGKSMGQKIDGNGRRGFDLYDSKPGVRDKRTFYVTGFDDKCPRQFTAANALFGAPSFYEQLRFSPAGKHLPFAATDKAYDKLKSAVCRAGKNKPCGKKIDTLDANTAFVSAYEFHEHNGKWKEFLVHDGTVIASAVKSLK